MRFMGIEVVKSPPRGGDIDNLILKKESKWIFELDTLVPKGLNEEIDFVCFL